MWVLQKYRVSLAWLPSPPKARLCQVVWYLKEGRILTQARKKKTALSTLFHSVRFPKRERAGLGHAVSSPGFCQCQCVSVSERALVEVWEKHGGTKTGDWFTHPSERWRRPAKSGLASWKGMTQFRSHFCVASIAMLWTPVIAGGMGDEDSGKSESF